MAQHTEAEIEGTEDKTSKSPNTPRVKDPSTRTVEIAKDHPGMTTLDPPDRFIPDRLV